MILTGCFSHFQVRIRQYQVYSTTDSGLNVKLRKKHWFSLILYEVIKKFDSIHVVFQFVDITQYWFLVIIYFIMVFSSPKLWGDVFFKKNVDVRVLRGWSYAIIWQNELWRGDSSKNWVACFFFSCFNLARSYSFITLVVLSFNLLLCNFEHGQWIVYRQNAFLNFECNDILI